MARLIVEMITAVMLMTVIVWLSYRLADADAAASRCAGSMAQVEMDITLAAQGLAASGRALDACTRAATAATDIAERLVDGLLSIPR